MLPSSLSSQHQTRPGDLFGFLQFIAVRFKQDRCLQTAGSLTFTTLLALVPFLTIVLMIFSALPVFTDFSGQFKNFLLTNLVPNSAGKIITVYMRQFSDNATRLTAVGVITLGVTSLMMIMTIERTFNDIWHVQTSRPLFRRVILYWATITLGPIIIGASLSVTSALLAESLAYTSEVPFADLLLANGAQLALSAVAFSLLYYAVPNCQVPIPHALTAGLVAAVVFDLVKRVFSMYIKSVGSYKLVYGAFSSFPIFLLWLYVMWATILFGAVLSAHLSYWRHGAWRRKSVVGRVFFDAIRVLILLYYAMQRGETCTAWALQGKLHCGLDQVTSLLGRLQKARLIDRNEDQGWLLRRAPETITLAHIYHLFVMTPLRPDRMHPHEEELADFLRDPFRQIDQALNMSLSEVARHVHLDETAAARPSV